MKKIIGTCCQSRMHTRWKDRHQTRRKQLSEHPQPSLALVDKASIRMKRENGSRGVLQIGPLILQTKLQEGCNCHSAARSNLLLLAAAVLYPGSCMLSPDTQFAGHSPTQPAEGTACIAGE